MKLIPISEHPDHAKILYDLLAERESNVNISHKKMPTWEEHCAFVANYPYEAWDLIVVGDDVVGTIYLTPMPPASIRGNEIGIFIFKAHQGNGYGPQAIRMLMERHGPRRYLANISPSNPRSMRMFEALGFRHSETTYERYT